MAGQNLLTVRQIEALPEGFHSDGGNLYLRVRGNGRSWVFRYKVPKGAAWAAAGKPVELGLGSYPARGLKDARGVAEALRSELANKRNPADYLNPPSAEPVKVKTFADYATAYITAHESGWRNPNETEAAYLRTKFFDRRVELMKAWGDFVGGKYNVIKLAASA